MGPISIFDKSFLQSLSLDESVWFDNFYLINISPLFYMETLADLDKEMSRGRTAEDIVGEIASKTPEMGGSPNMHHIDLLINNLLGHKVVMDGRPLLSGGKPVISGGQKGIAFDLSPEAKAYSRWQQGKYLEIERDFAKQWRAQVKMMTFESSAGYAEKLNIDISKCKNVNDAFFEADFLVNSKSKPYELIGFVLNSFNIPRYLHQEIVKKFQDSGLPPFSTYAPYAAHVVKIEIFFHICVSRGFISGERPSNKIDIAYLYYLPFCMLFISNDKLHKKIAPLFMDKKQTFVWGQDLKSDLKSLNQHYLKLPKEIKEQGIMSFASRPPVEGEFLTSQLWDKMNPEWRNLQKNKIPLSQQSNDKFIEHMKSFKEVSEQDNVSEINVDELDLLSLQRSISKKKGSWYQLPKNLKHS